MPALEISHLRKAYRDPAGALLPVVDVPSFALAPGEQAGLAGGSGCGKTTFLNLIAGILRPDSGRIAVAGVALTNLPEPARDRLRAVSIGYVFQTFNLLQGFTALENVLLGMSFGPGQDRARAADLLGRMGLGDRLHYHPRQLSVGQQQRVALARAVAHRPALVLADEPTGNLDPRAAKNALDLLREVCAENNAALLVVSHDTTLLSTLGRVDQFADINRAAGVSA